MKIFFYFLISLVIISGIRAEDDKYTKAMKRTLAKIDSLSNLTSFLDAANNFERIALAEKGKWLPYYWASYFYTVASFTDTVKEKKDTYLDKVDQLIHVADSLEPDNSEIYTLKGMIAQGRLQVDPMNRWMKYGGEATTNFTKAMELDSTNPRPEYLIGVSLYYTPEQFGGGPKAAKPYFEKSLKKYNEFKPENELMPNWGKEMVEQMLKQIGG